jgi:hypothetical protein
VTHHRSLVRASLTLVLLVCAASAAHAQTDPPLRRLQIAAGAAFFGGASLGDADANLRSSDGTNPYRLFATSSRLAGAPALDLRATVDLSRRFGLEAHTLFGHPELQTEISDDVENAPSVTAVERLDHYLIDGGILVYLDELRMKGWQPFAVGGGGYLRQLHEGLMLTEEGHLFYVGGGVRRTFAARSSGFLRGFGARGDVRLNILSGGITVEDTSRNHVSASASLFVVF